MKKLKKSKYVVPAKAEEKSRWQSLMPLIVLAILAIAILVGVVLVTSGDKAKLTSTSGKTNTQSSGNQKEEENPLLPQ